MKGRVNRLLPKARFARSVSVLAGGTTAGQIILVAASPVLSRLYSPEDFGLLAVYSGLLAFLGAIASLRYQLAIPLPESEEEAASVAILSLFLVVAMTVISAIAVGVWGEGVINQLNTPALKPYLWLLPLGLLLVGTYQVLNYWAIRTKAFTAISRTKLTQAFSMVGVQIGAYLLGPLALILGQVFGRAAGTTSLGILAIKGKEGGFRHVRLRHIRWAAKRYRRFPLYSSLGVVAFTAGMQLPPILFAALFSPAVAGLYMLAHRVLAMPMKLIGRAVADVFFSSASETNREGQLASLVTTIHGKMAYIAMPPVFVLLLIGPELFATVFGADWRPAGEFAQWMAPWVYMSFVSSPLITILHVKEQQAQGMVFQVILLCVRIGALAIGGLQGELMLAVALFSVGSALCYGGLLIWIIQLSGGSFVNVWKPSIIAIGYAGLLTSPLGAYLYFDADWGAGVMAVLATVASFGAYYGYMLRTA